MFWGCHLKQGEKYKLFSEGTDATSLVVSSAALSLSSIETEKTYVNVSFKDKDYVVAILDSNKARIANIGLYFSFEQNASISVSGKGSVDICGFLGSKDKEMRYKNEDRGTKMKNKRLINQAEGKAQEESLNQAQMNLNPKAKIPFEAQEEDLKTQKNMNKDGLIDKNHISKVGNNPSSDQQTKAGKRKAETDFHVSTEKKIHI